MSECRFVAYYRVSTEKQGRSGLGLEAQERAVMDYLNGGSWELTARFVEVETGKRDDRPELIKALRHAELTDATLIVAKLDRLSRDAAFLLTLQKSPVKIVFADMPQADAMTIGVMAMLAEWEGQQISRRTKAALASAKARGTKLGGFRGNTLDASAAGRRSGEVRTQTAAKRAEKVMHYVAAAKADGASSFGAIANHLNANGIRTPRGGRWHPTQVKRLLDRHAT